MKARHLALAIFCFAVVIPVGAHADGSPGLFLETETGQIPLPVQDTKVRGTVRGFVAEIHVTQVYVNPYDDVIEATYVFPLPENAAVNAMIMRVADREVVAEIKKRKEAEEIYEEARSAGHTAALMTQERPNIFTQKVGNIPPGHEVEVELTYVDTLPYEQGVSTFVFPTVVGPRFIPGRPLSPSLEPSGRIPDTDRVRDASRITPPALGEGETSAHRIDLELSIDPGLAIANLSSPSHLLAVTPFSTQRSTVRIDYRDSIPNKDFILNIDLRSERPAVSLVAHKNGGPGYVTLAIQPPEKPTDDQVAAKDLFFVVDNSGSMSGAPIEACKELVREALENMNPSDRFTIMRFSDAVSTLSATPLENTPNNVRDGMEFIDRMRGMGGTHMISGVRQALAGAPEVGRIRIVYFLTDGYIGNDAEILGAVQKENHADARLFSLGVGSSVNRYLLAGMARLGRGAVEVVRYDEDPTPVVERFYRRVRNPVLTGVSIDWGELEVFEQTPEVIGDLFDGQPLLVHARYRGEGDGTITLHGWLGETRYQETLEINLPDHAARPAIASLWARAKIRERMDDESAYPGRHELEITELALAHSLMSKYTAFVAVDREVISRHPTEPLVPVAQLLPLPEGVSRLALGELSRRHIPPGDPILSIDAPADARRVTAYFPFGLVKNLSWDAVRETWRGRFLVPAGVPDGTYTIIVAIDMPDGQTYYVREPYFLDSRAEEFLASFGSFGAFAGELLPLYVDAIEPSAEVYVHCPELGWSRITLESADGGAYVDWLTLLEVPTDAEPGSYEVLVVVRDRAGNRLEQWLTLVVELGPAS